MKSTSHSHHPTIRTRCSPRARFGGSSSTSPAPWQFTTEDAGIRLQPPLSDLTLLTRPRGEAIPAP